MGVIRTEDGPWFWMKKDLDVCGARLGDHGEEGEGEGREGSGEFQKDKRVVGRRRDG